MTEAAPQGHHPILGLLPFLVMAIITGLDVAGGPQLGYLPLLSLGPAFASLTSGIRRTFLVGALALVLCLLLALYNDILGTRQNNLTFASIAGVIAASVLASEIRQRRERELADVRTVAEAAQRVLLRPVPRLVGPVHAAVRYISATARARIGGDLYEVVATPKGVRLIVGDAQGKGLDAVETAALVVGVFRESAHDEADLVQVAARLERALARELTDEQFVTAVLAELDDQDRIVLLNCGHPAPLVVRAKGEVVPAEPPETAPPLGMWTPEPPRRREYEVAFAPDDQMLLYTDGVIEARDASGAFYPLPQRAHLLSEADPEAALDRLQADLGDYIAGPSLDDVAMLLLRRRKH